MGMTNQCKCDECGVTVEAKKSVGGTFDFPNGWFVYQIQISRNGGHTMIGVLSYCNPCGKLKLKETPLKNDSSVNT